MFASFGMRRCRRRTQTPRNVLVLFMFAMMLLSPIATNASVAGEADAQRESMAQATEVPAEEPVAEPTEAPLPTEVPAPTEAPLPTEEPEGEQLGAFEIDYWECADGYDIANPDLENLFMDCEGVDDVLFELLASDGVPSSQLTGEFGDSHVSFTEVPTGTTSVTQNDAVGPVSVFCNGIVQHGGPETGVMSVPVANDSIQWNLLDDEIVFCSWLTTPPAGPADLIVNKYACPEGYDVHAQDADPMTDCTEAIDGVTFIVTDDDPATFDIQTDTGDSRPGAVFFGGLPAGDYSIEETLPDDAESAFLWDCTIEDEEPNDPEDLPLNEGESWDFQMTGKDVECYWFNVQMAGAATEPAGTEAATEEPTGTDPVGEQLGAFEIEYRECAVGYDIPGADIDTILMECAQVNGVEFHILQSGGGTETQLTGEFGDSHVSFTEQPTGMTTVTQTMPFAETYVTCSGIVQNGGPETGDISMMVTNGAIEWNLLDDEVVFCNWFVGQGLAPATPMGADDNSVTVYKWDCPDGTTYGMDQDYYGAECATEHLNIPITLTDANGEHATTTQANGTQWDDVAPENGAIQIAEETPDGYGDPVVFCAPLDVDTFALIPSAGSMVSLTEFGQDTPWSLQCNWYNVPGDGNSVTVYKWDCPDGTTYGMDQDYYGAECATEHLNIPIALVDANGEHATTTQANGTQWNNVTIGPVGELQIAEETPDGYGDPVVFCWSNDGDPVLVPSVNGFVIPQPDFLEERFDYYCNWYNLPGDGSTIVVTKWECPEGTAYDQDDAWYEANCTVLLEDIDFKLTHSEGVEYQTTGAEGMVEWGNVPIGPFSILEHIPPEYEEPVVICGFTALQNGAILDGFPQRVDAPGGYFEAELTIPATSYFCNWYNIPGGPGEITVIKYTCPEGYDLNAFRAEPMEDCTELTNGVNFTLIDDDSGTVDLQTMTGDSIDGAVYFGGLEPGPYTIIETVPADTWYVFVLDCYGQRMGELRPYPLEFGDTLDLHLSAGESIVCFWYNVPEWDPEFGRLTVYKLDCSTLTYVSDVDCEVYEGGKDFDLVFWNGSAWEHADTQTTDGFGKIMWFNLTPGEYWVDELGDDWCFMKSEQLSDDGNWLNVYDNQETVVVVYNCGGKDPGTPGKTPTKYPDTGVGPDQSGPLQELPAFAPLTGLLALLASRRNTRRPNFVGEDLRVLPPTRPFAASPRTGTQAGPCEARDSYGRTRVSSPTTRETPMTDTHSRRRFAAAALALPLGGTALIRSGIFAQGDQVVEPIDGTPTEGTPASLCLTATPDAATPVDGSDCYRGAVPAGLTIASIGVEAPVEILETVGGVMQQPSDENHVAWYKETARLGELGNILIAGHLNWWGVPEAVFFALGTLEEGAEVVLVDEDGDAYTYAVEWVRQESNLEPPSEEVLGMTNYEAVTLITCGGEWDNSISEYDERTVARARRVAASGTPEAA